jgi:hypothetical protein
VIRRIQTWSDWQIALGITAVLRLFYSALAAALSFHLRLDPALIHPNAFTDHLTSPGTWNYALMGVWERFDALWYLHISQHAYDVPTGVIFYPFYPIVIRPVMYFLPPIVAAMLVSTIATFFIFVGLMRLAGPNLSTEGKLRIVLLVCAWPTSFILLAGYADALTLVLVVWAVVFARQERWWAAAICGAMAGAARPSGVLVAIPLFLLAWQSRRLRSAVVLLSPAGWFGYWLWLRWTGHPSVVETYRTYQGMTLVTPWRGLWETLLLIQHTGDLLLAFKLTCVLGFALLSLRREVRLEDRLFALAVLAQMLMYTGRPLLGGMRYLLLVYPAFLAAGSLAGRFHWKIYTLCLSILFIMNLGFMWDFLNWLLVL